MNTNNTTGTSGLGQAVSGQGNWAPGTTVREIEGHFNREAEPKGVAPISGDGGVPDVDYSTKDKIKDAVTGHHGSSTGHSSTGSGLTGSSTGTGLAGSSTTGTHSNTGATHGISETAERELNKRSGDNTNASNNSGSIVDKAKNAVGGNSSNNNTGTLSDKTGTSEHPAQKESIHGAGGHHGSTTSPTGTHGSTATGAHKEGVLDKIKHAISGDKNA